MTGINWQTAWFEVGVAPMTMQAWRGVEAQHVVSTMRLVDSADEQDELERILERSKPPLPSADRPRHYLLTTPFRYRPQHPSRFRRAASLGVWYGAESLEAACAEVAYWRHRFILDSAALLQQELLTEHTFFGAQVHGVAIDLTSEPWVQARAVWTQPSDYAATQTVADEARDRGVQWICYESVRAPGHRCAAVLDVNALEQPDTGLKQQTWHCKATRERVMMVSESQRFAWDF